MVVLRPRDGSGGGVASWAEVGRVKKASNKARMSAPKQKVKTRFVLSILR